MSSDAFWAIANIAAFFALGLGAVLFPFFPLQYRINAIFFVLIVTLANAILVISSFLPWLERSGLVNPIGSAAIWIGTVSTAVCVVCWMTFELLKMVRDGGWFDN